MCFMFRSTDQEELVQGRMRHRKWGVGTCVDFGPVWVKSQSKNVKRSSDSSTTRTKTFTRCGFEGGYGDIDLFWMSRKL